MNFKEHDYYLKEFYKPNGKQLVRNGNGKFNDTQILSSTIIKGEIKNGKQHGEWIIYNQISNSKVGIEIFNNGKFIEGQNITQVQSFNEKYFDYPRSSIDVTTDYLQTYYSRIDCIKYGSPNEYHENNEYHDKKYNDQYTDLPFYDFLYQNFDPPKLEGGYILAGFTIDSKGKLINTSTYSTLQSNYTEDLLLSVLASSGTWEPKMIRGSSFESTELFVFQFINGTYKILGDSRDSYLPIEYSSQFILGNDSLLSYVVNGIRLPINFTNNGFNAGVSIYFYIDENGHLYCNSTLTNRIKVSDEELIINNALIEILKTTDGKWKPSTTGGNPIKQYFYGIFTIKDGIPKFRVRSNNFVIKF